MTVRAITGVLHDESGGVLANGRLTITPVRFIVGDGGSTAILSDETTVTANGSGEVSFSLEEGSYIVAKSTSQGVKTANMYVDSTGPWTLGRLIEIAPDYISNAAQAAIEAAAAAAASAAAALAVTNAYFPPIEYTATAGQTQFALPAGITTTDNLQVEVVVEGLVQHDISFTGSSPILAVIPASPALDAGARVVVIGRYTINEQAVLDAAAQTAADAIATAADRVQTGIDAAAAETAADTATAIVGSGDGLWSTVGGTANALTLTGVAGALVAGIKMRFRAASANTGATTINLNGLGARACRTVTGAALPSGYIRTGVTTEAEYDGTYWVIDRATERGSNANGNYVRLADGTQICTHTAAIATATAGSVSDFSFPAAFFGLPEFSSINIDFDIGGGDVAARAQMNELKSVTSRNGLWRCRFLGYTGGDVGSLNFHLFAIGRWY